MFWAFATFFIFMGGMARYFSVVFAQANYYRGQGLRIPLGYKLFLQSWSLDREILLTFLFALLGVWLLSILDLFFMKDKIR